MCYVRNVSRTKNRATRVFSRRRGRRVTAYTYYSTAAVGRRDESASRRRRRRRRRCRFHSPPPRTARAKDTPCQLEFVTALYYNYSGCAGDDTANSINWF